MTMAARAGETDDQVQAIAARVAALEARREVGLVLKLKPAVGEMNLLLVGEPTPAELEQMIDVFERQWLRRMRIDEAVQAELARLRAESERKNDA